MIHSKASKANRRHGPTLEEIFLFSKKSNDASLSTFNLPIKGGNLQVLANKLRLTRN